MFPALKKNEFPVILIHLENETFGVYFGKFYLYGDAQYFV